MLVLRSPKGWTGPAEVDGRPVEGSWRSHQVLFAAARGDDDHRAVLERWLRSYRQEEPFDDDGAQVPAIRDLNHGGERRKSAHPRANGGRMPRAMGMPDLRDPAAPLQDHTPGP